MSLPRHAGKGRNPPAASLLRASLLPHEEGEFLAHLGVGQQLVPSLPGKGLEILDRAGIGGEHLEDLSRLHAGQRLLGAQDRQRAIQAARVEFPIKIHKVLCRMDKPGPQAAAEWLVTLAQLSTDDPASRMHVLRMLESLGAAVLREGAYLLPDTPANRKALEALVDYIAKFSAAAHLLHVTAASPAQHEAFLRLFDRSPRYEDLIKTVESLRIGYGQTDPSAISRVLHKQRRDSKPSPRWISFRRRCASAPARCSRRPTPPCTSSCFRGRRAPPWMPPKSCSDAPGRRASPGNRSLCTAASASW